jgi:hypothetical protein
MKWAMKLIGKLVACGCVIHTWNGFAGLIDRAAPTVEPMWAEFIISVLASLTFGLSVIFVIACVFLCTPLSEDAS